MLGTPLPAWDNSRAKWDSSQCLEGNGKKVNNIEIKLNTLITSKIFTGFGFNINPPKIHISIQCYNKKYTLKKLKILHLYITIVTSNLVISP